ncbi:MAG: hypothetical protein AAF380_03420 [Bacteroidota bacterium]
MKNIESKINELIYILRNRPAMWISGDLHALSSLSSYILFFEGFFSSLEIFTNLDFERKMARWYAEKNGTPSNVAWTGQLEMIHTDKTEKEKIAILLDTLEEFFKENRPIFKQIQKQIQPKTIPT